MSNRNHDWIKLSLLTDRIAQNEKKPQLPEHPNALAMVIESEQGH